jgi:pyrophosphatase PpaX
MKLKGIVFDLDGTLVDSLPVTFEAFNHGFVKQGGKTHDPIEIMKYFGPGEREIFAAVLGAEHADPANAAFRAYLDQNLERVPLHAGVAEMLESLKSAGMPISIVTGRGWKTTEVILRHHRMLDRFVTVLAHEHVPASKPSPAGLKLAFEKMRLDPRDAIYVGDMGVDIQAAHAAGARSAAALWDPQAKREALQRHSPHHWLEKPEDILAHI